MIGRLCEPSSELHVAERWYRSTALEDLLGIESEQIYDERLYRALDRVLGHKEAIEKHLVKRLEELFEISYDLLLYDVTSSYFEGVADPQIAQRGYSRDHRGDCVQVNIALVVTRDGMPLGYEIFSGNTSDVTTVQQIVERMEERFGKVQRVWVMDRGMVSAENIAWLNQTQRRYVIGTARTELKRWAKELADKTDWRQILALHDQIMALAPGPVAALNRAVVIAEVDGPLAALDLIEPLPLGQYHLFHAVRADLLRRLGRDAEAATAYQAAITRTDNAREKAFLQARFDAIARN